MAVNHGPMSADQFGAGTSKVSVGCAHGVSIHLVRSGAERGSGHDECPGSRARTIRRPRVDPAGTPPSERPPPLPGGLHRPGQPRLRAEPRQRARSWRGRLDLGAVRGGLRTGQGSPGTADRTRRTLAARVDVDEQGPPSRRSRRGQMGPALDGCRQWGVGPRGAPERDPAGPGAADRPSKVRREGAVLDRNLFNQVAASL